MHYNGRWQFPKSEGTSLWGSLVCSDCSCRMKSGVIYGVWGVYSARFYSTLFKCFWSLLRVVLKLVMELVSIFIVVGTVQVFSGECVDSAMRGEGNSSTLDVSLSKFPPMIMTVLICYSAYLNYSWFFNARLFKGITNYIKAYLLQCYT